MTRKPGVAVAVALGVALLGLAARAEVAPGDTGAVADHGPMSIERHFLLDHLRSQFWTGRLYVDPKPEKPNPNGYRSQLGLYPVLEPFDLKGVGAVGQRYIDPTKQDDSWLYLPSLRRVRRLSTAQRSAAH